MKVRKCTLYNAPKVPGGTRTRRRKQRKAIIREITRVVDWMRQVAIKTQCFIQYYVLRKLSEQEELSPSVFKPNCIYGFMQLILGQDITNNGRDMQNDRQHVFRIYQIEIQSMPGVSLMKKICSYFYTKLADVDLDPEP
jgi:hypothetical protein